jgi:hypothetical protein
MTASSVTGKGPGSSNKPTLADLSIAAGGPQIVIADVLHTSAVDNASPPASGGTVVFPTPLPGGSEKYVVNLTTVSGGLAYLVDLDENDDGDFVGFSVIVNTECDVHYMVAKKGYKPSDVR